MSRTFTTATDDSLIALIAGAQNRLAVIAPGLTTVPPLYLIRVTNGSFGAGGQCAFHREGGKVFSGNVVWICLPAIGKTLGAAGSAGESMAIPVASSSPHENPQTEPSGVQAASRSYR